jgi:hypothetical protein
MAAGNILVRFKLKETKPQKAGGTHYGGCLDHGMIILAPASGARWQYEYPLFSLAQRLILSPFYYPSSILRVPALPRPIKIRGNWRNSRPTVFLRISNFGLFSDFAASDFGFIPTSNS